MLLINKSLDILLDSSNGSETKRLLKHLEYTLRNEGGQGGTDVDILYAERQERQQYNNSLLLVPRDVEEDGQIVDIVELEYLFQF